LTGEPSYELEKFVGVAAVHFGNGMGYFVSFSAAEY
jgi:hypothetical protein